MQPRPVMDVSEEEEMLRHRLNSLKRDELENQAKLDRLYVDRELHAVEGGVSAIVNGVC